MLTPDLDSPSPENVPLMPPRPELPWRQTAVTLVEDSEEKGDITARATPPFAPSIRRSDFLWVIGILIMLCWPWLFLVILGARNGIQLSNHFIVVVTDNPHTMNFFVTLLGTIVRMIVGFFFSKAVLRFAQEWMTERDVTVFHVSLMSAFRNQKFPWGLKDRKFFFAPQWRLRVVLVGVCIGAFAIVPSGITSLIAPAPFDLTAYLRGTELDFASTAPDCLAWLNANPIPSNCDWKTFNGLNYTTCLGENQMVDVLESGRGNILSLLSDNSESLGFSQLGAKDGLQILGPIRGVLPIGPNGVPAFDTLESSPLSDTRKTANMLSYNYTLDHQGLTSKISCKYDTQSPVNIYPMDETKNVTKLVLQYNGTCDGAAPVLTNVPQFISVNSNNILTFWACKSLPDEGPEVSYFIYLRGGGYYAQEIGNISCTVSPIQPAIFPVSYQSSPGIFSLKEPIAAFTATFPGFIEQALIALGGLVAEAQNFQANLVAESVITFGVKSFKLQPYVQNPEYLRLYEAMIQGILEYEATYTRLLYSTIADRPSSCTRVVNGSLNYRVLGWSAKLEHIGYLLPMTLVNLASLAIILVAMYRTKEGSYESDPTEPRLLVLAEHSPNHGEPTGWADRVEYCQPESA